MNHDVHNKLQFSYFALVFFGIERLLLRIATLETTKHNGIILLFQPSSEERIKARFQRLA